MLFDTVEKDRHDRIRCRVTWDEVELNEDLSDANVDRYVVQLQSSDNGSVWNNDRIRKKVVKAREKDETIRITMTGFGAGDSFKLTHSGNESAVITFAAGTAPNIKNKLEGLTSIGDGNVNVRGNKGGPWVVTFKGEHKNENMSAVTVTSTTGCSGSVTVVEEGGIDTDYIFHNIKKRMFYRARVKAIAKNGCPGLFSAWTSGAQPNDNTAPPVPTSVTLDVDEHRATLKWDYPDEGGDADIPDEGVQFFVVEFDDTAGFGSLLFKDRTVAQHRSFRVKKPGNNTYYARVRAVDASKNKSAWVETSASKHSPSAPSAPSVSFTKINKRWRAEVTATTVSDTEREVVRYPIQLVHKAAHTAPTTGDKRNHNFVEGDATGDDLTTIFRAIPANHWVYVRERARDSMGKFSPWSAWTDAGQPATAEDSDAHAPGEITKTGHSTAVDNPSGTLPLDGANYAATYSTATYAALFAKIGYTHGGSGASFGVPDMRRRHAKGVGASQSIGEDDGVSETERMDSHGSHNDHRHRHTHNNHKHNHGHGGGGHGHNHGHNQHGVHGNHMTPDTAGGSGHGHSAGTLGNDNNPNTTNKSGSGTLAAGPSHTHTITGDTAQGGFHEHNAYDGTGFNRWRTSGANYAGGDDHTTQPTHAADASAGFENVITDNSVESTADNNTQQPTDVAGTPVVIDEPGSPSGHKKHGFKRLHYVMWY